MCLPPFFFLSFFLYTQKVSIFLFHSFLLNFFFSITMPKSHNTLDMADVSGSKQCLLKWPPDPIPHNRPRIADQSSSTDSSRLAKSSYPIFKANRGTKFYPENHRKLSGAIFDQFPKAIALENFAFLAKNLTPLFYCFFGISKPLQTSQYTSLSSTTRILKFINLGIFDK